MTFSIKDTNLTQASAHILSEGTDICVNMLAHDIVELMIISGIKGQYDFVSDYYDRIVIMEEFFIEDFVALVKKAGFEGDFQFIFDPYSGLRNANRVKVFCSDGIPFRVETHHGTYSRRGGIKGTAEAADVFKQSLINTFKNVQAYVVHEEDQDYLGSYHDQLNEDEEVIYSITLEE